MNVRRVDFNSTHAAKEFAQSLHETGFGVLRNHPINWHDIEQAYHEWGHFFHSKERFNYPFDKVRQDGYVPATEAERAKGETVKDIKEMYHLYFPHGRYPANVSDISKRLFDQTFALAKTLLGWIEDNLPQHLQAKLQGHLRDMICMERSLYRILYYPALTGDEEPGAIRAAAHGDINLITILPAATESGLQVIDKDNNWLDVPVDPEALVINIGDMLCEATDGYYRSTTHRVINPEGVDAAKPRLSMPLFLHASADTYISEQYPTAEVYLDERLKELGLK